MFVTRRLGATGSWEPPRRVSGEETRATGIGADVKTSSRGHVFATWPDPGSRKVFQVKSVDGGATWSRPREIARTFGSFDLQIPAQWRRQVLVYATTGAYWRGPARNFVYLAWTDLSGRPGCQSPLAEPRLDVGHPCETAIRFQRSSDGGRTWGPSRLLHDAPGLNDQFNPWLAVDESTGALVIAYYDTAGEARTRANVWVQASHDDGASWSAPQRVSSASSEAATLAADENQFGDYSGLAGFAGLFFPTWTDRRAGGRQEVWAAPLRLRPGAAAGHPLACPFAAGPAPPGRPARAVVADAGALAAPWLAQPFCLP